MKMTSNLGQYEELVHGSPGLGHMPRAMGPQDTTDGGIVQRIQEAVQRGMISPEAGQYLVDNLLQDDQESAKALSGMPVPQNMPPAENTFPHSLSNPRTMQHIIQLLQGR